MKPPLHYAFSSILLLVASGHASSLANPPGNHSPASEPPGWTAVPMTSTGHHHFTVACTVEDQAMRLVDTGAGSTIFDKDAVHLRNTMYNSSNGNHLGHFASNHLEMRSFGLSTTAYLAHLENWKVGPYSIQRSVVLSQATPAGLVTGGSGGEAPVIGLLGAEVLAANNAIVDVAGSTLYLKPSSSPKPSARRQS